MGYDCIVLVKQVPDTKNITGQAMREDGTVNRAALPAIFNPEDLNALELALQIRDAHGGTVKVITMGPPSACEVLREALYRGADDVILLTDRRFAASDTLATSYALSCAVRKIGRFDIILCGRQAIDGDTAQVGPQTAEKLGVDQITYVERLLRLDGDIIEVERGIDGGVERLRCRLPVLLTVCGTANLPRPPSAKRLLAYRFHTCLPEIENRVSQELAAQGRSARREDVAPIAQARAAEVQRLGRLITVWDAEAVAADPALVGGNGSPTKVKNIESVVLAGSDLVLVEPTEEGCRKLIRELIHEHILG
jgi:electron transfer flavoprotein beta subunit